MMVVHKFPFNIADMIYITMPVGAKILHVAEQNGVPCIWALVNTANPSRTHAFHVRGTGQDTQGVGDYVATFQMRGGALVFHIFKEE